MITKKQTINQVYPEWTNNGGVFALLDASEFGQLLPWKEAIAGNILDLEYHGNRSGQKFIAPLVANLMDETGEVPALNKTMLSTLIWSKCGRKWAKLWATMTAEYNPIENYDMTESATDEITGKTAKTTTNARHVESVLDGETESNGQGTLDATRGKSHAAFDGAGVSLVDEDTDDTDTTDYNKTTVDNTTTGNDREIGTESGAEKNKTVHSLTRHGNIGVTTSQQMLQSERELWDWSYFDTVFADVDEILTIPVFAECFDNDKYVIVKQYHLPKAGADLGGVKAEEKTQDQGDKVGIDSDGYLWYKGYKAIPKLDSQTERVGVDADGNLYYSAVAGDVVTKVNGKTGEVELNIDDVAPQGTEGDIIKHTGDGWEATEDIATPYVDEMQTTGQAGQFWKKTQDGGEWAKVDALSIVNIESKRLVEHPTYFPSTPGSRSTAGAGKNRGVVYDFREFAGKYLLIAPKASIIAGTSYNRDWIEFLTCEDLEDLEDIDNYYVHSVYTANSNAALTAHVIKCPDDPENCFVDFFFSNNSASYDSFILDYAVVLK